MLTTCFTYGCSMVISSMLSMCFKTGSSMKNLYLLESLYHGLSDMKNRLWQLNPTDDVNNQSSWAQKDNLHIGGGGGDSRKEPPTAIVGRCWPNWHGTENQKIRITMDAKQNSRFIDLVSFLSEGVARWKWRPTLCLERYPTSLTQQILIHLGRLSENREMHLGTV